MLSILIPVYNYDVRHLVEELQDQGQKLNSVFEILVFDDHSSKYGEKNKSLEQLPDVHYTYLPKNVGRSKIRNLLAKEARYDKLLFLDADVLPKTENFLENYLRHKEAEVLFGGILYQPMTTDHKNSLHYHYGSQREAIDPNSETGSKMGFSSANFLIHKDVFEKGPFDETIDLYGYEDVLFYKRLKSKVKQINNPVYHLGITTSNSAYIKKVEEALQSLCLLYSDQRLTKADVKLIWYYEQLEKFWFKTVFYGIYKSLKPKMLEKIKKKPDSLHLFDMYRLGFFIGLVRKEKKGKS